MLKNKFSDFNFECGTDEAGRGCLAGPVTAAAVILPPDFKEGMLNDSKKLTEKQRKKLREIIEANAVSYAVCHIYEKEIDSINILNASIKAMHGAIKLLKTTPEFIIVDGNRFQPYENIPYKTIVKGDAKFLNIAAASVLAKTYRDDFMTHLNEKFPMYQWHSNKGYPTKTHRTSLKKYGITEHHRVSFKLLP